MKRIPPSQKIRNKMQQLLEQGLDDDTDITTPVFRLGVEQLVQELLEQDTCWTAWRQPAVH